jgi:hypothetical protein
MSEEKPFQLDANELAKKVPFVLQGQFKHLVEAINKMDLNKDGKSDLAQAVHVALILMPLMHKLNQSIDFNAMADYICALPFVTDKELAKQAIHEAAHLAEKA